MRLFPIYLCGTDVIKYSARGARLVQILRFNQIYFLYPYPLQCPRPLAALPIPTFGDRPPFGCYFLDSKIQKIFKKSSPAPSVRDATQIFRGTVHFASTLPICLTATKGFSVFSLNACIILTFSQPLKKITVPRWATRRAGGEAPTRLRPRPPNLT